ncbi:hypothetical protein ABPG75_013364 [Micractinium tetrahymenae]
MEPASLVACLARQLEPSGIDIVAPLALSWYNNPTVAALGARIPGRGAAGPSALCILIANSRSLWEPFVEACAVEGLLAQDNPLDTFLERRLSAALALCTPGLSHRIYWSHRRTDDLEGGPEGRSEHVAFQRMAHFAGLAYLDETSHLCLHPRFGPWFSLRCAVIFDDIPYTAPQPAELPNPLPLATRQYVALALHTAVHNTSKKFHLPEADVEVAEAVLAEASIEPVLEGDSDEEEAWHEQAQGQAAELLQEAEASGTALPAVRCPSSSARSTVGSERAASGGTTPACSSGCSSPRAGTESGSEHGAATPEPAGPEGLASSAAPRLPAANPLAVPRGAAAEPAGPSSPGGAAAGFGSPLQVGSLGSTCSRRSSLERESKPSMRAVAANWRAWVAVRDAPCPGHPWRYSQEQIEYHYTRDRSLLLKAMLRRNLGPACPQLPATGLLDPALQAFHAATMAAREGAARALAGAPAPAVPTPGASPEPSAVAAA